MREEQSVQNQYYEQDINLLNYWHLLWKNKRIIISTVLASTIFAGFFLYHTPKTYLAEASLLMMDQGKSSLGGMAIGGFPLSGLGGGGSVEKLIFILDSKTLAEQVVNKLNIVSFLEQQNKDKFSIAKYMSFSKKQSTEVSDHNIQYIQYIKKKGAVGYLKKRTHISSKDGGMVMLSVEWRDPDTVANVVSTYISELSTFLNDNSININFKVIDPAQPPTINYKPQVFKVLVLSFLASAIGSFLLVFIKEAIQSGFDKADKS